MKNKEISSYIANMQYNTKVLLRVEADPDIIPDGTKKKEDSSGVTICEIKKSKLDTQFDSSSILAPIEDVVWIGNLVYLDQNLANGIPADVKVGRAGFDIRIDLPGLGDKSINSISEPNYQNVSKDIANTVEYWITKIHPDGYQNKSLSSFNSSVSYSREQVFASLGINYKDVSTEVSAKIAVTSDTSKKITIAFFKQVVYSVTYQPGQDISAVFSDDVTFDDIKALTTPDRPLGYVSQVDYGRLIFLRMESSSSTLSVDADGVLKYLAGNTSISAEAKAKYEKIVNDSSFTLITIGGDAVANASIVSAKSIDELFEVIKGEKNNVLSKTNTPLPIGYVIKELKNSSLAKLSLTSEYSTTECKHYKVGYIAFKHSGAYVAYFKLSYKDIDGNPIKWESGDKTSGYSEKIILPAGASNLRAEGYAYTGLVWDPTGEIFNLSFEGAPNKTIVATGTTLNRSYSVE